MQQRLAAVLWAALVWTAMGADTIQSFVLKERLDRGWRNELVSFEVTAEAGVWPADRVGVRTGGDWVPFQLSDAQFRADGSLQAGTLWLMADLEARGVQRWEAVRFSGEETLPAVPATDLAIEHGDGFVDLQTEFLGLRLFEGTVTAEQAIPAAEAPAPQLAMRLPDGTAFGGGAMFGPVAIAGVTASLVDAGPLFARVVFRYDYSDGNVLSLEARLNAGDNAVFWDAEVAEDAPANGWRMDLGSGLPPMLFPCMIEHFSKRESVLKGERAVFQYHKPVRNLDVLALESHEPGLVTQVTPWGDWWDDYTQTRLYLWMPEKEMELVLASRDPGAWIDPLPPGRMRGWGQIKPKLLPIRKLADGRVVLDVNLAAGELGGVRRWLVGARPMATPVLEAEDPLALEAWSAYNKPYEKILDEPGRPCPRIGGRLNEIQHYVLEWDEDPAAPHPRLFVSSEEIASYQQRVKPDPELLRRAEHLTKGEMRAVPSGHDSVALAAWLATGDDAWIEKAKLVERLENHLGRLGGFDKMRHMIVVATLYDALIDSPHVPKAERPYLKAKMAYLGYAQADARNWSMERGYCSGNPNMSVSHIMSLGVVAALLRDHPMAETWAASAVSRFGLWMQDDVGPNGEWRESHHYVHVSTDPMLAFALAAQRAGLADFLAEGKFRDLLLYICKMVYTAPDAQRGGRRVTAPMGRRSAGTDWGLTGVAAKAYEAIDPAFSRTLQFVWAGTGYSRNITDARFGGFEHVLPDPGLSMENPHWTSERFPWWGAVLRHGYGTDAEHYVNVVLPGGPAYAFRSAYGSIVKFISRGVPVGGTFTGDVSMNPNDAPRQELMQNRVTLARDWKDAKDWYDRFGMEHELLSSTLATLPRMDILRADLRMTKDSELWPHVREKKMPPDVPAWPPVERRGQPPLDWQRQLVFIKDADPDGFSYLVFRDTVSGGQPTMWQFWTLSQKIGTPEEAADREAFLADAPGFATAPWRSLQGNRFTAVGQFGLDVEYYIAAPRDTPRHTLRYGYVNTWPTPGLEEYQDLLDVRMDGDGHYFVVLAPRRSNEPAPDFATLGDGRIVRVSGAFGTDLVYVSAQPAEAEADGVRFEGTVASHRVRGDERVLSLGAPGSVRDAAGYGLAAADGPAELRIGERIALDVPPHAESRRLELALPFDVAPADPAAGADIGPADGDGRRPLVVPAGVTRVELKRTVDQ